MRAARTLFGWVGGWVGGWEEGELNEMVWYVGGWERWRVE